MTIIDSQLPPHDIDAEEAVIGSLLIDGQALSKVRDYLLPKHFYSEVTRLCYEACLAVEMPDQITVAEALNRLGNLETVGGAAVLSHYVSIVPTSLDLEHYAEIVLRLAASRELLASAGQIANLGYAANPDGIDRAYAIIDTLRNNAPTILGNVYGPREAAQHLLNFLDDTHENRLGFSWGFADLDVITTGLYPQDYVVVGARPSMGKTEFLIEVSNHLVKRQGRTGLFVSLEMSLRPLQERRIATSLGLSISDIRRRMIREDDWGRIADLAGEIEQEQQYWLIGDHTSGQIASIARRLHSQVQLDFIVVDYVQLLKDCRGVQNVHQALSSASKTLKSIGIECNIPIIVASQLNRQVESRVNKRPRLSDLRESGSLEEDADLVLLLYRDEMYYRSEAAWEEAKRNREVAQGLPYPKGVLEVYQAKNRQLGAGAPEVKLQWIPDKHKYGNSLGSRNVGERATQSKS